MAKDFPLDGGLISSGIFSGSPYPSLERTHLSKGYVPATPVPPPAGHQARRAVEMRYKNTSCRSNWCYCWSNITLLKPVWKKLKQVFWIKEKRNASGCLGHANAWRIKKSHVDAPVCVCRIYEINSFNKRCSYEQYSKFFKDHYILGHGKLKEQLIKANNKHKFFRKYSHI